MSEEKQELYKIVFRGELVANMGEQEVRRNLAERLRFSEAALDKLFSGAPMILKADLDQETANRYAKALWQAGARCNIEPMVAAPPIEVAHRPVPRPAPRAPQMVCPKCSLEQDEAEICVGCGVVVAKFRQRLEEEETASWNAPPAAAAASAPASPPSPLPEEEGVLTWRISAALAGTRPWVRLVAIMMMLAAVLGLAGAAMTIVGIGRQQVPFAVPIGLLQAVSCLLYFIPAWFLLKYAGAIRQFLDGGAVGDLETALAFQKSFWKFVGILTLIMVIVALLGIAAAVLVPTLLLH